VILDAQGRPLKRAMGFVGGYVPVRKALQIVDSLDLVGTEMPAGIDNEELDAARNRNRMRRTG
jgi:hypothetical protein